MISKESYFVKTKIPIPFIDWKKIWDVESTDATANERFKSYTNFLNLWETDIAKRLYSIKLYPRRIRVFRWEPGRGVFPWHIDGSYDEFVNFAINWVLDGHGSIQWNSKMDLPKTPSISSYASKKGKLTDVVECEEFGHACIVNTSIPHRVVNINKIHRVSVSMTFQKQIKYNEAVEILRNNGLLED